MAALWLVLEWYGATSQVPWLFLLAAWILALLIVAGVYSWWNRAGLRLRLVVRGIRTAPGSPADDLPGHLLRNGPFPAPVFEGDGIELELGLNTTGGSRGPAWINGYVGGKKLTFGTGLVPAKGWTRLEVLRELHRGPIGATGWTIGSSDPLGFFQGRRSFPDAEVHASGRWPGGDRRTSWRQAWPRPDLVPATSSSASASTAAAIRSGGSTGGRARVTASSWFASTSRPDSECWAFLLIHRLHPPMLPTRSPASPHRKRGTASVKVAAWSCGHPVGSRVTRRVTCGRSWSG